MSDVFPRFADRTMYYISVLLARREAQTIHFKPMEMFGVMTNGKSMHTLTSGRRRGGGRRKSGIAMKHLALPIVERASWGPDKIRHVAMPEWAACPHTVQHPQATRMNIICHGYMP